MNVPLVFTKACPNGMTNITASSGSLKYPESGTYGKNETKCWSITVPDTYAGILFRFSRYVFHFFAPFNNVSTLRLRAKVVTSFYATTNYCRSKHRNGRKKNHLKNGPFWTVLRGSTWLLDYKARLEEAKNNFQLSVFKLVRYMSIKNYNLCKKQTWSKQHWDKPPAV